MFKKLVASLICKNTDKELSEMMREACALNAPGVDVTDIKNKSLARERFKEDKPLSNRDEKIINERLDRRNGETHNDYLLRVISPHVFTKDPKKIMPRWEILETVSVLRRQIGELDIDDGQAFIYHVCSELDDVFDLKETKLPI